MSKVFDFNALKKKYMTVKLPDENNTVLMITTPSKKVLDSFLAMKNSVNVEELGDEAINELYGIVCTVMNYNKAGIKIPKEKIEELLDFEDVLMFIRAYADFISEVSNSKN